MRWLGLVLLGCPSAPVCEPATTGMWTASGACFGMARTVTATFDPEACTVAFDDWATATGTEPTGAVLVDSTATLEGGAFDGCAGELRDDSIIGTCPDGCAFELGGPP